MLRQNQVLADGRLSTQQRGAFEHLVGGSDLAVLIGVAGAGKSTMLEAARRAWEAQGFSVKVGTLAGIAAENLEIASGIQARTLASWERSWDQGYELLGAQDVLVIDEAGLIGTRQLARILERAEAAGTKVVLVGDPEQLQPIEAGTPFRGIAARTGAAKLTEVRRQKQTWQRHATKQLATGRTSEALAAYERRGWLCAAPTRMAARTALLAAWDRARRRRPRQSRLMLAYTRDEVQGLNEQARAMRAAAGELGKGEIIETERGPREIGVGDRLYFLKNERALGVKNGSLGTVELVRDGVLQVRLDGEDARWVGVDTKQYPYLDHGYAATVHKARGATVDLTYVLATPHFDRHSAYVALSRHRDNAAVFYGGEDFHSAGSRVSVRENLYAVLSRARPKELAHDYLEDGTESAELPQQTPMTARQREVFVDQVKSEALAAWRSFRAEQQRAAAQAKDKERNLARSRKLSRAFSVAKRPGLEM